MSDTVISANNLGKKYIIGHQQEGFHRYKSLRDTIASGVKSFSSKLLKPAKKNFSSTTREEFWALKEVSFEIKQGDRVGIIGRNGAGKSTLLKILSRITEPTKGSISIKGRVASLLEVGTGFHPELTGRENIFLNGAILGMSKAEIKRKFDEIVAFAEIEKFLDTPVKRYSSGMYVRLAFAVAAHLEPEILIVDEVLAVGDAAFQKKCFSKLENIGNEGRTIIFVSHDLKNITGLCSKAFLLDKGSLIKIGRALDVANFYTELLGGKQEDEIYRIASSKMYWKGLSNRHLLDNLDHTSDLKFILNLETGYENIENFHVHCDIHNERDECVIQAKSELVCDGFTVEKQRKFSIGFLLKSPNLSPGNYYLAIYIWAEKPSSYEEYLWLERIKLCSVSSVSQFKNSLVLNGVISATIPFFDIELSKE
jgi:lipopolysaccharide transport system ATP-binding protein